MLAGGCAVELGASCNCRLPLSMDTVFCCWMTVPRLLASNVLQRMTSEPVKRAPSALKRTSWIVLSGDCAVAAPARVANTMIWVNSFLLCGIGLRLTAPPFALKRNETGQVTQLG